MERKGGRGRDLGWGVGEKEGVREGEMVGWRLRREGMEGGGGGDTQHFTLCTIFHPRDACVKLNSPRVEVGRGQKGENQWVAVVGSVGGGPGGH